MSRKPSKKVRLAERDRLLEALGREMQKLVAEVVLFNQAVADRLGMNPTDLQCLNILSETGPVAAGRLAEETGLTTGAVTGVIDRLERAGYAWRERDPKDKRRVIVHPLPERARSQSTRHPQEQPSYSRAPCSEPLVSAYLASAIKARGHCGRALSG